jgi:hypothetical protein
VGNFDDDLAKVGDVDLVIEAVVENIDIKRALFEKLEALVGPTRSSRPTPPACASPPCSRGAASRFASASW